MELRQLQYLVAVADEASFTRAAAQAHVAQPGVSAQIRRLERELGQVLLDRSGGTVRVTEAGAAVLPYARAALAAVAAVRDTVDALAGLTRGHVTAGIVGAISSPDLDLPGLLAGFHRDHPGIEITLTEAGSDALIAALRAGRLDVALVAGDPALPPELAAEVVVDEPLVIAVSRGDALARRKTVTLDAIRGPGADQPAPGHRPAHLPRRCVRERGLPAPHRLRGRRPPHGRPARRPEPGRGPPPRIRHPGPPGVFAGRPAGPPPAARAHRARLESGAARISRSPRLPQPRTHATHPPGHPSGRPPVTRRTPAARVSITRDG